MRERLKSNTEMLTDCTREEVVEQRCRRCLGAARREQGPCRSVGRSGDPVEAAASQGVEEAPIAARRGGDGWRWGSGGGVEVLV